MNCPLGSKKRQPGRVVFWSHQKPPKKKSEKKREKREKEKREERRLLDILF